MKRYVFFASLLMLVLSSCFPIQRELTSTAFPTSLSLGIGSTMISDKDGMTLVFVPAGEFIMGDGNSEN